MRKILYIAGCRPNFIKLYSLIKETEYRNIPYLLVHTGQHYSYEMNDIFFKELDINSPHITLNINQETQIQQITNIMIGLEPIIKDYNPYIIVVIGDVNSTLAAALVASKLNIKIAHVEAGLRSFDLSMSEEINRILVDDVSDFLFTSEPSGLYNLKKENINKNKIYFVGNVLIDTLVNNWGKINKSDIVDKLKLKNCDYIVSTFHRPSNVDNYIGLNKIIRMLKEISEYYIIIVSLHPRTDKYLEINKLKEDFYNIDNLIVLPPLGYIDFLKLVSMSKMVITDSGGVQEETTFLKIPCFTIRKNTERPITIKKGTNCLIDADGKKILEKYSEFHRKKIENIKYWDGRSSVRILDILTKELLKE